jgi:hypothetical protein
MKKYVYSFLMVKFLLWTRPLMTVVILSIPTLNIHFKDALDHRFNNHFTMF